MAHQHDGTEDEHVDPSMLTIEGNETTETRPREQPFSFSTDSRLEIFTEPPQSMYGDSPQAGVILHAGYGANVNPRPVFISNDTNYAYDTASSNRTNLPYYTASAPTFDPPDFLASDDENEQTASPLTNDHASSTRHDLLPHLLPPARSLTSTQRPVAWTTHSPYGGRTADTAGAVLDGSPLDGHSTQTAADKTITGNLGSASKRKGRDAPPKQAQQIGPKILVSYNPVARLDSATACREYLAYVDTEDSAKLAIEDDDVDLVKTAMQHYTAEVYNALLHPFAQDPPDFLNFDESKKTEYRSKQDAAVEKVQKLLVTPIEQKAAKARCFLLVDAAVAVHERGVPKALHDRCEWYITRGKKTPKDCHLDMTSICSGRIAQIVRIVKDNKLVAMDVLKGHNIDLITQDAEAYLQGKFSYLRSNGTRQARTDSSKKANMAGAINMPTAKKRKPVDDGGVEDDAEEDFAGVEVGEDENA